MRTSKAVGDSAVRAGYGGERDAPTLAMCLASKMRAWFLVRFIGFLSAVCKATASLTAVIR